VITCWETQNLSIKGNCKPALNVIETVSSISEFNRGREHVITPKDHSSLRAGISTVVNLHGSIVQHSYVRLHRDVELAERLNRRADSFLNEVYSLDDSGQSQLATLSVFDYLEGKLFVGEFEFCDRVLEKADVARLSTSLMRAFLTITAASKANLSARPDFYSRVDVAMSRVRGAEITKRLIGSLS
jgi:hypothetical protein